MSEKHTSGPWHIERINNRTRSGFNASIRSPGCDVAEVYGWEDEENVANARLIAAAPELLAALQWYVEHDDSTGDSEYYAAGLEAAQAAIAKATAVIH